MAGLDFGKQGVRDSGYQETWRERWPYLQKPPGAQSGDSLSTNGKESRELEGCSFYHRAVSKRHEKCIQTGRSRTNLQDCLLPGSGKETTHGEVRLRQQE